MQTPIGFTLRHVEMKYFRCKADSSTLQWTFNEILSILWGGLLYFFIAVQSRGNELELRFELYLKFFFRFDIG